MITKQYDLSLKHLVSYRPDTSDEELIRRILIDRIEYSMFSKCAPKVIFDVGANIGATSLLFANNYPDAKIYAFEPEPENFKLLEENTGPYENIYSFNVALGSENARRVLKGSDDNTNLGGFSFHPEGTNEEIESVVQVLDVREVIKDLSVETIDLLKIDTEGCEFEIISSLPKVPQYIMGEAHGVKDWELFDLLSETHELSIDKKFFHRCYPFYALRKTSA